MLPKKLILLAVAIAVTLIAGTIVTSTTFSAIGLFFYSYQTFPIAITLAGILLLTATASIPLANTLKNSPILAISIAIAGAAAAIGIIALAGTAITVFFSGDEKQIIYGIIAISIAIAYIIIALINLIFAFKTIKNY